ncbi:MAG: hypothetical protein SRB2_04706 [Desulfobacteraceae bacterium Eth-SRB2]|nr:MAG: hypothetical protein SRB2_04706 [Desulfobacteraceae bacterium Eth-SRB2]
MTDTSTHTKLAAYYMKKGIHPEKFDCQHKNFCRKYAFKGNMTEAKMSMVGSQYGSSYPKLCVVSLDPPSGATGEFAEPYKRTTEYMAKHEDRNYTIKRTGPHWSMTLIIIKDILCQFGYKSQRGSAVVEESYAGRPIENVEPYFAHVNIAKCSMNNPGKKKANRAVHERCSSSYLLGELRILKPDVLLTQGDLTNEIMGILLMNRPFLKNELPSAFDTTIEKQSVLWLPMPHPSYGGISTLRKYWTFYVHAIQDWKNL